MKRSVLLWVAAVFSFWFSAQAQTKNTLFDTFLDSYIYDEEGRVFVAKLNYSFRQNQFVFIDASDGDREKNFAQPEKIRLIKVGGRAFQMDEKGRAKELLLVEPSLFVVYEGHVVEGKRVGYGGRSQTTAIKTYSTINANGVNYHFKEDQSEVDMIQRTYLLKHGGKTKRFTTGKQFLKIYPKEKRRILSEYIKENDLSFDIPTDVISLVKYAVTL